MAVERPFCGKNVKSAMLLGQARGVAILAAAETGLEVQEYSPLEVKQAVVGYGRAAKEQIEAMVQSLLRPSVQTLNSDAADALAVALCLAHSLPWQISLAGAERTGTRREAAWRVREKAAIGEEGPMIARIRGHLVQKDPGTIIVEASGIGYQVFVSLTTFYDLPEVQQIVTLAYLHPRARRSAPAVRVFHPPGKRALPDPDRAFPGSGPSWP